MHTGVFHSHPVLRFPMFFSVSPQRYLGKSSIFLKEIAVRPSPQKGVSLFTISSIRSDGNKGGTRPRKSASRRTERGDEDKRPQSSDGIRSKPHDQEEIIALFKRIQSSISEGDSQSSNKRSFNSYNDNPSPESILDVLFESGEQVQDKISNEVREKDLTTRRNVSRKEQEVQQHQQEEATNFKLTRLPSDFVKKPPIPSPSTPTGKVLELSIEESPTILGNKQVQSQKLEEMKLPELKELAKFRGIKGYSKLKKAALIEILRS